MFSAVFIVFAFTILVVVIPSQTTDEIAWDDFFTAIEPVEMQQSIAILKALPLSLYFDVTGGKYRLGILGRNVESTFPSLIHRNSVEKLANVSVVDSSIVFMHFIVALKSFIENRTHVLHRVRELEFPTKLTIPDSLLAEFGSSTNPVNLHLKREIFEMKTALTGIKIDEEIRLTSALIEKSKSRREKRTVLRDVQNERIVDTMHKSQQTLDEAAKTNKMESDSLREVEDTRLFSFQMLQLQIENEMEHNRLDMEINKIIESTTFRIEEEARVEREQEEHYLNIIKVKDEARAEAIVHVINAVFQELSETASRLFSNPLDVLFWSQTLLAVVSIVVVLYEVGIVVISLLTKKRATIPTQTISTRKKRPKEVASNAVLLNSMVLTKETKSALLDAATRIAASDFHRGQYPNILITGRVGDGKSMAARAVAEASGLDCQIISAGDLDSRGSFASLFLRECLEPLTSPLGVAKKKLIILDQAESIVSRNRLAEGASLECFFVLLQGLRHNSNSFSVILTASDSSSQIDSAVLDRMDKVVRITQPTRSHRLELILRCVTDLLISYVGETERKRLESLLHQLSELNASGRTDVSLRPGQSQNSSAKASGANSLDPETDLPLAKTITTATGVSANDGDDSMLLSALLADSGSVPVPPVRTAPGGMSSSDTRPEIISLATSVAEDRQTEIDTSANFLVKPFLQQFLEVSKEWSCRDIRKVAQNIQSTILASERCVLTGHIWKNELQHSTLERNKLNSR